MLATHPSTKECIERRSRCCVWLDWLLMFAISVTSAHPFTTSQDPFDLDQLLNQIAQFGEIDQQMPVWGWAIVVAILLLILRGLGKRRRRLRSTKSKPQGYRGPRDTRGPVHRGDNVPQPGRYGPTATRNLTMDEIVRLRPGYAPAPNGLPDPGEIIWTWVPYAEGNGEGKDRPVLIIARIDERSFAACYLSTKQHSGYVSIGKGPWDRSGRESFVSPERVLRVYNLGVRREGQVVPRAAYEKAVAGIAARQKQQLGDTKGAQRA